MFLNIVKDIMSGCFNVRQNYLWNKEKTVAYLDAWYGLYDKRLNYLKNYFK